MDGLIGLPTLPDGCDFDWLVPGLDSGGLCSVKEVASCYRQEVDSMRGGFDFHCPPRALGLAGWRLAYSIWSKVLAKSCAFYKVPFLLAHS